MALAKIGAAITLDGEKEYKQAISNINRSMSELKSEMNLVNSQFQGQQNSIEALTEKGKVLQKMYDTQAERCQTLAGALRDATITYGENSEQATRWRTQLNNAEAELNRLNVQLDDNSRYLTEARNSTNGCATSIDEFGKTVRDTTNDTNTFGDVLKANLASDVIIGAAKTLAGAIKEIGNGVVDVVKQTAAYADNIITLSNNTGIATDTLQELQYMQELTDVSLETVTSSMAKQIKSMSNAEKGSKDYCNAYEKLGVRIKDANGQLRDSEEVYWECIDALGQITNETERDSTAMQLFGKSAQDLNSLIKIGSEGVREYAEEARNMGAVLDESTLGKLGEADDAFQRMNQSLEVAKRSMGIALAPTVTESIGRVTDKIIEMEDSAQDIAGPILDGIANTLCWILDNADLIISALGGIGAGFAAFKTITAITTAVTKLQALSTASGGAVSAFKGLWLAMSANPITATSIGIGALAGTIALIGINANKSKSEVDLMIEATQKTLEEAESLRQTAKEVFEEQDKSDTNVGYEAERYQKMADKLYTLAEAENLSNEEKAEMKYLVEELNKAFPDMGLEIDSVTGKLSLQRDEINKVIESYQKQARVEAAKKNLTEIAEQEIAAEMKINELQKENNDFQQKKLELEKEYNEIISSNADGENIRTLALYEDAEKASKAIQQRNDEIAEQQKTLDECTERYNIAIGVISKYDETITEASNSNVNIAYSTKKTSEELTELTEKYNEVKTSAEESILSQIGLFDEFTEKSKYSKEEILKNLQSQIDGMKNWSNNMEKATKLGVSDKIIKEFRDMGIESSSYLNEIVKMSEQQINELNEKWETKLTLADTISSELAEAETSMNETLSRIATNISSWSTLDLQNTLAKQTINSAPGANALSNTENAKQIFETKQPVFNIEVTLDSEKIAKKVTLKQQMQDNRFNPRTK